MRKALPSLLFLCIGTAASAQLSLLPQIGLENSKTSISSNDASFNSLGSFVMPKANFRLTYQFKKGHGPYLGLGTSPAVATITTSNPDAIMTNYSSSLGKTKLRMEGGYQLSTKPIQLQKNSNQKKNTSTISAYETRRAYCRGSYRSGGSHSHSKMAAMKKKNDTWNMRIQPSAGFAYTPAADNEVFTTNDAAGTSYNYKAGNWNTALTTGVQFAFAKGNNQKFVLGLQHLRGLGNLDAQTIHVANEGKATSAVVKSRAATWSLTFGIPIALTKSKPQVQPIKSHYKSTHYKSRCGSYGSHIRRI